MLAFVFPGMVAAEITVHAVFDGQAVLSVDGERAVVAAGETGPGGLRVLQAGGGRVQVEVDGETRWLQRGSGAGAAAGPARSGETGETESPAVRVHRDSRGEHSLTVGVNGRALTMNVDRDADSVMLRERDAERAGVDADAGRTVHLQTDRGRVDARRVTLDEVRVGAIRRSGISAVIVPDDHIPRARLGCTFLDQVDLETRGNTLILR